MTTTNSTPIDGEAIEEGIVPTRNSIADELCRYCAKSDAIAAIAESGEHMPMAGQWTDEGQSIIGYAEKAGPCKFGLGMETGIEAIEPAPNCIALASDLPIARARIQELLVLAAKDDPALGSVSAVEVRKRGFPDQHVSTRDWPPRRLHCKEPPQRQNRIHAVPARFPSRDRQSPGGKNERRQCAKRMLFACERKSKRLGGLAANLLEAGDILRRKIEIPAPLAMMPAPAET
jgi:hypothetical protein